ncbi:MAG TPA: tetratricopeptide repeat protein [Tepidisphaeraceae bacterium]|nr:tetratricopeptide repeat protein [Tepidisphaeraceae bacterium]
MLTLDELRPKLRLPASRPATHPTTGPAPLDAIALFAEARAKILANQRLAAINLLQDAIRLDPGSFELRYALGEAHGGIGTHTDQAIQAFLAAAAINPNHLGVQTELGRQYLAKGALDKAIEHLRLALLTSDYRRDNSGAASAEFLLARALQRNGNDRAALDAYARLLVRLRRPAAMRGNNELAFLASQPEALFIQVGDLYVRGGQYDEALRAYELAAARRPESFDYAARVVRTLIAANRREAAAARAAEVVRAFRASNDSLELLRETYRTAGGDAAVAARLTKLHQQSPDDRAILYSLVNILNATDQRGQAERLLLDAVQRGQYGIDDVRRLFGSYASRGDVDAAALLLTSALAARPDSLRELLPLWSELLQPSRGKRLRLGRLQALTVPPDAEAAKQFWISQLARVWSRDVVARTALEESARRKPPLPPAFRVLLNTYWSRGDWDKARKVEASEELIATVEAAGNASLAAELRGLLLLNSGEPQKAADELARAQNLAGESSLDLQIALATATRAAGDTARFEQILWKLISDYPTAADPYETLLNYYISSAAAPQAIKVLRAWLAADPESVNARVIEANIYLSGKQTALAEQSLLKLFERHSDDAELLNAMRNLYGATGRIEKYIDLLEAERVKRPENRASIAMLVELYAEQKRTSEAMRVLEAAQAAVADDPDLLYYVAHLYTRIGQEEVTEQTLAKVVKLDPNHAAASNDLGYFWADKGKNLDRAEQLIRNAVEAEPDNQSFLDSLGWVLYKRSKFDEAREQLEAAIAPAALPDPVVLDHLGDTLYRLGRTDDAIQQWQRAQQRLAQVQSEGITDSPDRRRLRLELQRKLKQAEDGQPVTVAPVVGAPQQAKN